MEQGQPGANAEVIECKYIETSTGTGAAWGLNIIQYDSSLDLRKKWVK